MEPINFEKCNRCKCYRQYPTEYLNDQRRLMKTCIKCRVRSRNFMKQKKSKRRESQTIIVKTWADRHPKKTKKKPKS